MIYLLWNHCPLMCKGVCLLLSEVSRVWGSRKYYSVLNVAFACNICNIHLGTCESSLIIGTHSSILRTCYFFSIFIVFTVN
ncbi:testis expressed gene 18 [Mus musculus]|uniref:Testis protein TEX18 n=1 Tax=Mus musculus TaxID=10090 RepID=Q99MV9_MOUSE|nr:testis protein TEX18 [Mus musculus]EDL21451.1 testis expressed gene 18 [Mus musculus]